MIKALILTDGKAGHENQSKAFARALGYDFKIAEVHFKSKFHKAVSYLFDRLGIVSPSLFKIESPLFAAPAVVLGTGSGTFYATKTIASRLGCKCGVVLYPRGYTISTFDCVLAPRFDRPVSAPNVIEIPANLVAADEAFYEQGVKEFLGRRGKDAASLGDPVAVIIGGPNKCSTMSVEWMKSELDKIFHSRPSTATSYWVTTSRRTPPEIEALVDSYPWDYKLLYSKDHFNPIPAFVKLAKRIYVTAESTGMLSEACTFGSAEVIALDNLNPGPHKFRRFVEDLRAGGYVDGNRKVDLSAEFAKAKDLLK